ncbi:FliH/SctL family protein [Clostridium sp. SM-530-WT-3G]|uniref:FliH/SctL family protein n=1 Tax=Clostridium sp. SM-530-WT-3G TaxID=2725303 RepID=UPI00145C423A|nr:FliH/SctL family protein [Clostridium sp. SM-530-WT-3G]NME82770.1 flagellar biosynthesis protein [Clostridium sp. SM-530-WT-3G]
MRSSYSLIKNNFATTGEKKIITTHYLKKNINVNQEDIIEEELVEEVPQVPKVDPEELLKRYEEIGQRIIQDAENEKKAILLRTQMEASVAEKNAYEKGYEQGIKNGYDDGYKKAYDENIENAKQEASTIIEKAEKLLNSAQKDYSEYLESKRNEIVNLALNIAESITRKTLSNDDSLNSLIDEAFQISKGEESIIIRANSVHVDKIKENSERWKISYGIKNDIFIATDDSLEPGNAVLEKSSGVVKVGVDIGMEQIKKAIFG